MATMEITAVTSTGNNAIDSLLFNDVWSNNSISYSFPSDYRNFVANYSQEMEPNYSFGALTLAMQNGASQAFAEWAAVANLSFNKVEDGATYGVIRLAQSSFPATAHAHRPANDESGGDVWFGYGSNIADVHWNTYSDDAFYGFLHEIGHALGLKHPGNYGKGDEAPFLDAANDAMVFSVMSYYSYPRASSKSLTNAYDSFVQTPMMLDIAAIQYIYGANFNYNANDTTYAFSPNDKKIFRTVWDGNGIDTYDASAYAEGVTLQLAPGAWSTLGSSQLADLGNGNKAPGSVCNALLYQNDSRSLIENAIGGSGDDILRGSAGDNVLTGGAGNDHLWGGTGGNDTLIDVSGDNMFWWTSGEGNDTISSSGKNDALYMYNFAYEDRLGNFTSDGSMWIRYKNGGDQIVVSNWLNQSSTNRIQSLVFNDNGVRKAYAWNNGKDVEVNLYSAEYAQVPVNYLECVDSSNAILRGSTGNDVIKGGSGNDHLWGGTDGNDLLSGGAGSDSYWFGVNDGADTISADSSNNQDSVVFYGPGFGIGGIASTVVSSNNLTITLVQGASLTLQDWGAGGGYRLNRFNFQTGSMAGTYSLSIASDNQTPIWTKLS